MNEDSMENGQECKNLQMNGDSLENGQECKNTNYK